MKNIKLFFIYILIILFLTVTRVFTGGWRAYFEPMDMRILERYPIQHEAHLMLRSTYLHLSSINISYILSGYTTEEHRALLPIFTAAIFTNISSSFFWGSVIAEVTWWWASAVATFFLAKKFHQSNSGAFISGLLVASSPLASAHIGAANLHAASSLGLSIVFLIALDLLLNQHVFLFSTLKLSIAFLFSSIIYTYQWVLIPWMFFISLSETRRGRSLLIVFCSTCVFILMQYVFAQLFALFGIVEHKHLNDPIGVLMNKLNVNSFSELSSTDRVFSILINLIIEVFNMSPSIVHHIFLAYSPVIFILSLIGLIRMARFFIFLYLFTLFMSILLGIINDLSWVVMSSFPLVYIAAGNGSILFCRIVQFILARSKIYSKLFINVIFIISLFCLVIITNIDIFGDYFFVRNWYSSGYKPF